MDVLGELEQHIFVAGGRPIHINDVESITAQYDKHVRFIVVDYITQLIGDKKHRSRHEEVHDIALRLKNIAMEYDVPVMALSQLSRDVEKDAGGDDIDRPPKVSDLRASGGIEETSDVVLLLQRQRQTANQGNFGVSANLEIGKNRDGPVGFITMNFNTRYNRFDDIGVNRGLNLEGV
jgi:replicative DNA helicase